MFPKISCSHSAVGSMSVSSIQTVRFLSMRAARTLRAKSRSLREYEMKTCAMRPNLRGNYRCKYASFLSGSGTYVNRRRLPCTSAALWLCVYFRNLAPAKMA